jgi:hypothetical protein
MYVIVILMFALPFLGHGEYKSQSRNTESYAYHCEYPPVQIFFAAYIPSRNDAENGTSNEENNDATHETRYAHLTISEWVQDIIALALAIITSIYVGITAGMSKKISRQADIMELQAHNAAEQVIAAQGSNNRISHQISLMQVANDQTKIMIEETRANADAARDSAKTALLNARAIINAERPWLFIEIKTIADPRDMPGITPKSMAFSVKFKNWGKTPAEIVGFDHHPDCRDNTDDLPLPPTYSLDGEVMAHTRMVPPGETWCPPEDYFRPDTFLVGDQWTEIRHSKKRFIYWGRIQYRDLIEESKTIHELKRDGPVTIHETCFCYFWSPRLNEFLITGPLGYNKHS